MKTCKQCFGFFEGDKCAECGTTEFHIQPTEASTKKPIEPVLVSKLKQDKVKEKKR